jgi:hypothetical protein
VNEETRACDRCGGAGRDAVGDTCTRCRGHGYLPAPCEECHTELAEGRFCSAPCEANAIAGGRA